MGSRDQLTLMGQEYRVVPDAFMGLVDVGTISNGSVVLGGWAVDAESSSNPSYFAVFIGDELVTISAANQDRPDISQKFLADDQKKGFTFTYPLHFSDAIARDGVRVYAVGKQYATLLPFWDHGYLLNMLNPPQDYWEYARIYQIPQTRISDEGFLIHATDRFTQDSSLGFSKRSAALAVCMYNILNKKDYNSKYIDVYLDRADEILLLSSQESSAWHRITWISSISLVCAYLNIIKKKHDEVARHLNTLIRLAPDVEKAPGTATNVLLAHLLQGYLLWKDGKNDDCMDVLRAMPNIVRTGVDKQPIDRMWGVIFEQVVNLQILAEAMALMSSIKPSDFMYVPEGRKIEFKNLKKPLPDFFEMGLI